MGFHIAQWYNKPPTIGGTLTLEQVVDIAKSKGADGIRLYARAGMEPIDMPLLNSVLDMLASKGFRVVFCPFMNWKDHPGYFGSAAWFTQWEALAQALKNDARIWAFELFNEPNNTTWAPGITGIPEVQAAIASCIDRIRATGDNHPIVLPDCMVYGNYSWAYMEGTLRPNTFQAFHFWMSSWAATTYGSGLNFWQQWGLARIETFEAAHPDIRVIIDEIGAQDERNAGWASLALQTEACVAAINWCLETGHDFSWHMYGWNMNPVGQWYTGKADAILALTKLGTIHYCPVGQHWDGFSCVPDVHTCPVGQHWDETMQTCVPDFVPLWVLDIWTANGGTTTPTGRNSYPSRTQVPITATAAEGYVFGGWLVNNQPRTENPLTLTMTEDLTVMPIFNALPTCPTGYHWDATANACVQDIQADFHWKVAAVLSFLTLAGLWLVGRKRKKR